ncbi:MULTISPECIES: dihydrodipicolinate synthase family protein [Pseudomonadota]|uniref:Dihydrodipicolinate synthase family protein n=1 Tax=Stutzerimonas stutzeri TaxID=316 RepID=A0A2N8SZ91_STUST|nr:MULTISPECIES: dihydrodipicolinate synthase family protein [Pseudomonadota]KWT88530.1 Dihydrodipicolinate synthase [Variovorax sp. WDL1]MCQ4249798.1 dihydrodipicolinate synthase family protein [Stutzerimonas stutzeri]PNG07816.1 dihydrodipicolinate synthase family protein [Stutzerimonas stutzeri]PNG59708.1 4-hydroxy-tetrahydrodipicolinate synthase [Variovorax sp. B4]PNG60501.1 4-hydroxy-tetrahydrodipicolinate synthase [Variovorax sp. B2]
MTHALGGLWVPTSTPFNNDGSVNAELFLHHCRTVLDEGADGLAILGTTSEANSLSVAERSDQLDHLLAHGIPASQLMPGTGACSIEDAVFLTRAAVQVRCAGVLLLPPFYYKGLSDDGLFAFFSELIERVGDSALRLYLYHIPPFAQVGFSLSLIERLLQRYSETIAGLKDSSGDFENTLAVIRNFPQLRVFPGSEAFLLDGLHAGGAGCITATGNINAKAIKQVHLRWKEAEAPSLQSAITRRRKLVEAYPLIPAVKAVLAQRYADPSWRRVRAPLLPLEQDRAGHLLGQLARDGYALPTGQLADHCAGG